MSTTASLGTLDGFLREQLDVLTHIHNNMELIRRVALQYTNVQDFEDFAAQINALHAVLPTLMDASELILTATEAGIAILTAEDAAAQRALLELGTAALLNAEDLASQNEFAALQAAVAQLSVTVQGLAAGLGTYASQTALTALTARVATLESNQALQDLINQLIVDLEGGVYNASLAARVAALEAALAGFGEVDEIVGILGQIAQLNGLITDITSRQDGSDNAMTQLVFRIAQVETAGEASLQIQVGLNARLTAAEGTLVGQATALQELGVRTTAVEGGLISEASARTALQSQLTDSVNQVGALSTAMQSLQTSVSSINGVTQSTSAAVIDLAARVTGTELGLDAAVEAHQALVTQVTLTENGIEALASDVTALNAALTSTGNLLPNSAFEADLRGWEIFSRGTGWLTNELERNLNPSQLPPGVSTMALQDPGTPSGNVGVRTSERFPIVGRQRYIVSAYLAAEHAKAQLFWRLFDSTGQEIDYGLVGETTNGPTTNLDTCTRVHQVIPAPLDAAEIQLQWWLVNASGFPVKGWLFRPMLENATAGQTLPSPWAPGSAGFDTALATAIETMTVRVAQTEDAIDAQAAQITALGTQVTLKPVIYVQALEPTGGTYRAGDQWFDTDNGNKQHIYDGTNWVPTSSNSAGGGVEVFVGEDPPASGMEVGDLWVDTDDGNKLHRWDGTIWADISDERIDLTADAVQSLATRVTATEDVQETQAGTLTDLAAAITDTQTDLAAEASAREALSTQVLSIAGSKATVIASPTMPPSEGRVAGDIWVDTDDGNRLSVWEVGTGWVLRQDMTQRVFADNTMPPGTAYRVGDLWFDLDDNNRQYRWDGDEWLDVTDQRIISQASQITTLQSQVALLPAVYVQDTAPPGSTYAVGDIWFDSDDSNKQYIWNGTIWDDTSTISGAVTYAQTNEPTGGAYNIGDLWVDLDDGNKLYRWNGAAWVDVSDQRMVGQAAAISSLTTRVEAAEGAIDSQANQITTLNSSVAAKTRTFVQASAPTATAIGDVWIDVDDGNKLYAWDGTSWVLRRLEAGASTYAQTEPPATGNLGDLWVDTNDSNKLYRWNGTAWILVTDGRIASHGTAIAELTTRTTTAEGTIATHTGQITSLNASLATKPRIYADPSQPTGAVVGDLWIDTDDSNKLYTWNGSNWIYRAIPTGAKVYRQPTAPGTGVNGDLWFDSDDGNKPYIWSGGSWVDNTDARTAANASAVSALNASVAQKTKTFVQATAPSTADRTIGDLWIDTANGNLLKAWNGSAWVAHADSNKVKTYAQNDAPTGGVYAVGDLWIDSNDNNLLYRWNGSNWVSVADVRISAQASQITALTSEVAGKATVSALNSLTTRVLTIEAEYGVNLLPNPGLVVDDRNWGTSVWNSASRPEWSHGRDLLGAGYQVAGTHNFGMAYAGTTANADEYYAPKGDKFPVEAGVTYGFQALMAMAQVAACDVAIEGYNAAGTYLGDMVQLYNDQTAYTGGTNRANWRAMSAQFNTYASAAYACLRVRARTKAGGVNPRVHVMEAMLEKMAPGQPTVSPFNFGSSAAWAEWNLMFNINGHISGIQYAADGHTANFIVDADKFQVLKPGGGAALTWSNGILWNKGTTYSVIQGQDMTPEQDVIFWVGPNPASPQVATKADASLYFTETGGAVFRGVINQSLLTGSAMELGSTRIHTGGGRLAPFTLRDFAYKGATGSNFSATVTLADFQSPDVGTGYHFKRFSRKKADVILTCHMHGDGSGGESVYIEVQYDGGTWQSILSKTGINVDYRGGFTFLVRYTTAETWNTVAFRARTTNANTICLAFAAEIDNTYETGNTAGTNSGMDATSGGGGTAPPGDGGGGGGGGFCVEYSSVLPDGRLVRELQVGDLVECVDMVTLERGMFPLLAMGFGEELCYRVHAGKASVIQSASTPMDMPDGSVVRTPDLTGCPVLLHAGYFAPAAVELLGVRKVCKPDLGNRMFFAGETANTTLATHNIQNKDGPMP